QILNSQTISMLVGIRTVFSYICCDGKQPRVYRFTATVLSVFPQPNDLIVEVLFDLTIAEEYLKVIDIESVINAGSGTSTTGSSCRVSTIVSQIFQDVYPGDITTFFGIWSQFFTDVDAVDPVTTTSQSKIDRTVVPASFIKSLSMYPFGFAVQCDVHRTIRYNGRRCIVY